MEEHVNSPTPVKEIPETSLAQGQSVDPMEQLVGVERLTEIVWSADARPCAKWVRQQTRIGVIPCVVVGKRVWYVPKRVIEALESRATATAQHKRRGRPLGSRNKPKSAAQ